MCFLSMQCLPRVIIWRRKAAVVTTVLCCGDLTILLASHSPNSPRSNKSEQCFLLKVLILISHNLWENLSAMSPLRSGKFHHGKVVWWSEYRAQLLHVLVPPPQLLRAVCLFSHCWHLVFCKPEPSILQEATASVDDNLLQAHRCAMMLSAVTWALNYCYWPQDYLIHAIWVVQHGQFSVYLTEGKKPDNKIRTNYLRPVTSSNTALQVFPFSLFLWFCSWITQPIFPDRLFLQSKGQCTVNFSFESSNLHLLSWGNIVWPDSGIFCVTLGISLANSSSSSCMECLGPQIFLSMPISSKHFKTSDCLFYSFILFNEAFIIP